MHGWTAAGVEDVVDVAVQPGEDAVQQAQGGALPAAFEAVGGGGGDAEAFAEVGVGGVAAPVLQEVAEDFSKVHRVAPGVRVAGLVCGLGLS